jgi:hypothetical protein
MDENELDCHRRCDLGRESPRVWALNDKAECQALSIAASNLKLQLFNGISRQQPGADYRASMATPLGGDDDVSLETDF